MVFDDPDTPSTILFPLDVVSWAIGDYDFYVDVKSDNDFSTRLVVEIAIVDPCTVAGGLKINVVALSSPPCGGTHRHQAAPCQASV